MITAIISFLFAFAIAFGRQSAALGKIKASLWFFPNFEKKRLIFSIASLLFGGLALYLYPKNTTINVILITAVCFLIFAFIFDLKRIFPEIKKVERKPGKTLDISDDTEIIGTFQNNVAVAYPLDVLMPRHIIHDQVGGVNIVASYCAICRSGMIFSSEVDGENLYFTVSAVWRRNMGMLDNQTQSIWQQATGECIYGKQKGKQLELLSGENTNWKAWVEKYPNSEYAYKCTEARKGFMSRKRMLKALLFVTPKFALSGYTDLTGLPKRETVLGLSYNGVSRAYPISELENQTSFSDTFNGKKLNLEYNNSSKYLTAIEPKTNKQIIVEKHWWLGWKEFHPETEIWKKAHNKV